MLLPNCTDRLAAAGNKQQLDYLCQLVNDLYVVINNLHVVSCFLILY
jgi:hypothetical protein